MDPEKSRTEFVNIIYVNKNICHMFNVYLITSVIGEILMYIANMYLKVKTTLKTIHLLSAAIFVQDDRYVTD